MLLTIVHVVVALFLVLLVLVQSGKGAEISASFGGSSQTVFGSSGGANFFTRATAVLATIFMLTSIGLTLQSKQARKSVFDGAVSSESQSTTPPPVESTPPSK